MTILPIHNQPKSRRTAVQVAIFAGWDSEEKPTTEEVS